MQRKERTQEAEAEGKQTSCVLFVAKSVALGLFIANWLCRRSKTQKEANELLGRLHILAPPMDGGPRVAQRSQGQLQLVSLPNGASAPYNLAAVSYTHLTLPTKA